MGREDLFFMSKESILNLSTFSAEHAERSRKSLLEHLSITEQDILSKNTVVNR